MIHLLPILFRARRRVPLRTPPTPPDPSPNLLLWSEQFQQAAWTASNLTVTADQVNDPDALLTADLLTPSSIAGLASQQSPTAPTEGLTYTASIYILAAPGHGGGSTFLTLGDGISSTTSPATATGAWQRISVSRIAAAGASVLTVTVKPDVDDGTPIYAWGAKLEEGNLTAYVKREGV